MTYTHCSFLLLLRSFPVVRFQEVSLSREPPDFICDKKKKSELAKNKTVSTIRVQYRVYRVGRLLYPIFIWCFFFPSNVTQKVQCSICNNNLLSASYI